MYYDEIKKPGQEVFVFPSSTQVLNQDHEPSVLVPTNTENTFRQYNTLD